MEKNPIFGGNYSRFLSVIQKIWDPFYTQLFYIYERCLSLSLLVRPFFLIQYAVR